MSTDIDDLLRRDGAAWRAEIDTSAQDDEPMRPREVVGLDTPRRRRLPVVALVAAAVAVIALGGLWLGGQRHGSQAGQSGTSLPTAGATTDPLRPSLPRDLRVTLPLHPAVTAAPSTVPRISMPWKLSAIDNAHKTLAIYYVTGDGDCYRPAGVAVAQTARYVEIQVLSTAEPHRTACPTLLALGRAVVTLNAPLGHRTLLHASVDKNWKTSLDNR